MVGKRSLVMGVGINDADYIVLDRKTGWLCPFYRKWTSMLSRCYSEKVHNLQPNYLNTFVCEEWNLFSNFKAWMEKQDWKDKELDKDLLGDGTLYSPENCCFLSKSVNLFMTDRANFSGKYPTGVSFYKKTGKYKAQISTLDGKRQSLGYHDTVTDAWKAWIKRKAELATILAKEEKDARVAIALMNRYDFCKLDELPDGTWRLIYNGEHIPDFSKIECFKIVREN